MLSAMVSTSSYREGAEGIWHSATRVRIREDLPRIVAGAYLKAPCPVRTSNGLCSCDSWPKKGPRGDWRHFTKGGAREKSSIRGVEKSMLIFQKEGLEKCRGYGIQRWSLDRKRGLSRAF